MKFWILILVMVIPALSYSADSYTTSKGAVFTRVHWQGAIGDGWRDPSGIVWSQIQGTFGNTAMAPDLNGKITKSEATEVCGKIGGLLPSFEEFNTFTEYFDYDGVSFTDQGDKDLQALFNNWIGGWQFWTSSVYPDYATAAYTFDSGYAGFIGHDPRGKYHYSANWRWYNLGVICIKR